VAVRVSCDHLDTWSQRAIDARHEVELVHERHHVAERSQARDRVAQVAIVRVLVHLRVAPSVVRVEEDDVRLDAEPLQVEDARLEVPPERGVEARRVVAPRLARERMERRLVRVVA
jgi:hypothetical protein